ncbi:MAG: TonB-dependent receptor [Pseudomonadales bacterium]|nr:TonB-dependent receptor [Pseudomonadales bacterium]
MQVEKILLYAALTGSLASLETAVAQATPDVIEEIVVVAHPLSGEGLSQASKVLQGAELDQKRSISIGDTLSKEPGIHSAQFGKTAGRPVIHGLGGPRIRVMEDRIDTLDVSVTSADHAVSIDPFVAERIEVLKGPSTLLYGSGAIGGVVDVHTGRIPHVVPEKTLSGGIETRFDSNTNGNTSAAKLNGGVGGFAWHLDGTWKDGDEYEIPGFAESAELHALEEAEGEGEEEEEVRGHLPGSQFDAKSYAGGASYIFDRGFFGVSVGKIDSEYGLPGGHGHEEEEEGSEEEAEGNPLLKLEQTRTDLEFGLEDPFGPFTGLNIRLGINDYEHQEIEPNGEVATDFSNEAWELRAELLYDMDQWTGVLGVQHTDREFSAVGEEAFVPPVDTRDTGLFWVAERNFSTFDLEGGLRIGKVKHEPQNSSDEDFTTYSASLGMVAPIADSWQFGLVADYSSRAPVSEELYSNGPHLVTNAFELGDPNLDNERAANLAATLRYDGEVWDATVTTYVTKFSDFIYEQATGAEEDGLPVFQFQQNDARFVGIDVETNIEVAQWETGSLKVRALADYVNAELDVSGDDDVPRIPPLRYGLGVEFNSGVVTASVDFLHVDEQDDVSPGELSTSDYDDLSARISVNLPFGDSSLNLFAAGKNLTDDEQRLHTSFIKDFAPAPGRTFEIGARLLF